MTDHYRVHALELGLTEEKTIKFLPLKHKKSPLHRLEGLIQWAFIYAII
ncbi:TPA: hypothetical protein ACQNTM_001103 [Streptococcus pyogenes]